VKCVVWVWLILANVTVLGAAHVFRYETLPRDTESAWTLVWDRWLHRLCVVAPLQTVGCTVEDLQRMSDKDGNPMQIPKK